MAVNSVLRLGSRLFEPKTRLIASTLLRTGVQNKVPCAPQNLGVVSRLMGGGPRKMIISPSRHEWKMFKDQVHFYILLTGIPLGGVILYSNIFVGPAQLTDIPEGYEPERWEYFRHPIQRFFARYVYSPPEKSYEINLHHMVAEQEKKDFNILKKKVMDIMKERGDYKDWYYVDMHERGQMTGRDYHDDVEENWSMPERMKGD